ncbi:MAG: extracellular solute-binding protein [Deltaproteobacteria bacterium]|nr:extracellular solute-binding protein [Deltaproteobacteria bacterium]
MMTDSRLFLVVILVGALLLPLGCGRPPEEVSRRVLTFTDDGPTREIIRFLGKESQLSGYRDFDRSFKGLLVPESLLPFEPFVLGLSTESKVPAVLLLDAPWVQRYGAAGWLYELERTNIFLRNHLAPAVAEAFSVAVPRPGGPPIQELVAVPTQIKGNILFFRQDLLQRYQVPPPRTWEELRAACRKILPLEKSLKHGLLFHYTNFVNDFYPILWGFGGRVIDDRGRLVLHRKGNLSAAVAALSEIRSLQGGIAPGPKELAQFEAPGSLRQAFYRGEALFMINWNTRLNDLKELIRKGEGRSPGALVNLNQVGVAPIPCQTGQPHRYANVGSFGWGVNRFAVTSPEVIADAKRFINLVADVEFQLLAARIQGQVPSLESALKRLEHPEVQQLYRDAFAVTDMRLRARPQSRRVNNTLEKHLLEAINGQRSPEGAFEEIIKELRGLKADD